MYVKEGLLVTDDGYLPETISVIPLEDYKIRVEFETGEVVTFDMTPYLDEPYFHGLRDKEIFNSVSCGGTHGPYWVNEELELDAVMSLTTIWENGVHVK